MRFPVLYGDLLFYGCTIGQHCASTRN